MPTFLRPPTPLDEGCGLPVENPSVKYRRERRVRKTCGIGYCQARGFRMMGWVKEMTVASLVWRMLRAGYEWRRMETEQRKRFTMDRTGDFERRIDSRERV